jgi:hypothetical protein
MEALRQVGFPEGFTPLEIPVVGVLKTVFAAHQE